MRSTLGLLLLVTAGGTLSAQNVLHGNGVPSAYVDNSPGILGGSLTVRFGSPTTPGSLAVVSISGGFTPFLFPFAELGGPVAIDPFDPAYQFFFFGLDGNGDGSASLALPIGFAPPSAPPLFVNTVTFESVSQWSVSRISRIDWMLPDSWEAVAPLAGVRQLHTATALGSGPRDNVTEVLVCGGATGSFVVPTPIASAELFSPLSRTLSPLPSLALPRSLHRALRLQNGLVLVTGGTTTGGVVTATCEYFDAPSQSFVPAPSMNAPRSGHAMTLLDDGRVLVTGGVADWQNAATNFIAALNTAQNSAEIFDPATSTWAALPVMASKRVGHSQVQLADGRVLVISGINGGYAGAFGGGQVPTYTTSCEIFDPATLTFAATTPLVFTGVQPGPIPLGVSRNGSAFSGASLLSNGAVLVTGGFAAIPANTLNNDASEPHFMTQVWQGGAWSAGPPLPVSPAFHTQESHQNGALLFGGVSNSAALTGFDGVLFVDATQVVSKASMPQARGMHSTTRLHDGTLLIYGGGQWPATIGDGAIYLPD